MWASGSKEESLNFLRSFAASLSRDLETETTQRGQRSGVSKQKLDELARLLARCYFKQGEWQMEISDNWATVRVVRVTPKLNFIMSILFCSGT